jgi:hypothetical protein
VDYDTYMDSWSAYSMQLRSDVAKIFTLKEPSEVFSQIYDEVDKSQRTWLGTKQIEGMVANSEASLTAAMSEAARMGNTEAVLDYAKSGYSYGALHKDKVQELVAKYLPIAKYNAVYNQLDALGDYDAAISILTTGGEWQKLGLTSDQRDEMLESLVGASGRQREVATRKLEADAKTNYEAFLKKHTDGTATADEAKVLVGLTFGTSYATGSLALAEKYSSHYGTNALDADTKRQDVKGYELLNELYAWKRSGAQGDAPWTDATITTLFKEGKLREEQIDSLVTAWQTADEPQVVVDFRSEIFQYMLPVGKLKPLAWTDLEKRITDSYRDGELSKPEHRELLDLAMKSREEYEKRLGITEEEFEFNASQVIYDSRRSEDNKRQWMVDNAAHFSGEDYSKWFLRILPDNGEEDRKSIITSISDFFGRASQGADVKETRKRELAIEEYYAKEAMQTVFINNPKDIVKWQQALNSMLADSAITDLESRLQTKLGALYPRAGGLTDWRILDILEAGREAKLFGENAALTARFAVRSSDVREREQKLITDKVRGIEISDVETDPNGESLFYDRNNNKVYYVKTNREGNRLRRTVFSAPIGGTNWSKIGVE